MSSQFRRRTIPYGFPFLDHEQTYLLQQKTRQTQRLLSEAGCRRVMPGALDFPETFSLYETYDSFRLRDHLGDDLALRNDVTVQLIKGFANQLNQAAGESYRYYYTVPVFRDIRRNYPALREVYQTGTEWIGFSEEEAINQLIRLADQIFKEVFEQPLLILVGDVRVYRLLSEYLADDSLREVVLQRDAPSLTRLFRNKGWPAEAAYEVSLLLLFCPETSEEFMKRWVPAASHDAGFSDNFVGAMQNVMNLYEALPGLPVQIEPLLIRKADYYSGLIFEGYVSDLSFAPLRGGAYDHLVSHFSNRDLPASGMALDISSLVFRKQGS